MSAPVRHARIDDVESLVELRALMFEEMGATGARDPRWRAEARAWFSRALADDRVCIAVSEDDGDVVASAVGQLRDNTPSPSSPHGREGLVSSVVTAPGARREGRAAACLDEVLAWFETDTDADQLELMATGEGTAIYERAGFVTHAYPQMRRRISR